MSEQPGLEYTRELHAEVTSSNRDLYTRAQTVLTLDGLVIGVFGAVISASPDDVATTVDRASRLTSMLAIFAISAMAGSVVFSFLALYSRHRAGALPVEPTGLSDGHLWFFARIADVPVDDFVAAGSQVDALRETEIRLRQVATMAPIMCRRASWVNAAYATSALGLVLFVAAGISYLIGLPS